MTRSSAAHIPRRITAPLLRSRNLLDTEAVGSGMSISAETSAVVVVVVGKSYEVLEVVATGAVVIVEKVLAEL